MPSGGARAGSGRKKMSEAKRELLYGNPNKLPENTVVDFSEGEELPSSPPDYLSIKAKEIYTEVRNWLKKMNCLKGILPQHLIDYAHFKSKWFECEEQIKGVGMIIKDDGKMKVNPFIQLGQGYQKQAQEIWSQIYIVVRDSKSKHSWDSGNSSGEDDVMEQILSGTWKGSD